MNRFIQSLKYALQGFRQFTGKDRNIRIELAMAAAAILLGWITSISAIHWLLVLFCIGLVLSLEMINSAIEKLCDLVSKEFHPEIKTIKDMAAGAVLIAAIFSLVAGLIIFIPELINLFNRK